MCNESWAKEPQTFQQVAYIPVFLLGLLLNVSAVIAFLLKRRSWTDTHIYMLNLALADCALVFFLPVRVYDSFSPLEPSDFCTAMISIHYINMYASIFTVTCISMHRYICIRFPFWARVKNRRRVAALVCTLIWVTVITICFAFISDNTSNKLCTCYSRKDVKLSVPFFLVLEILGYLFPLVTTTFCSIQTSCILKRHESEEERSVQKKTFALLVTANLVVFIVCYTPIHVALALVQYHRASEEDWSSQERLIHNFQEVAEWIATTNCCLDSLGYYFLLRQYFKKGSNEAVLEHLTVITNQR